MLFINYNGEVNVVKKLILWVICNYLVPGSIILSRGMSGMKKGILFSFFSCTFYGILLNKSLSLRKKSKEMKQHFYTFWGFIIFKENLLHCQQECMILIEKNIHIFHIEQTIIMNVNNSIM